jgi:outer membrane protein TolC
MKKLMRLLGYVTMSLMSFPVIAQTYSLEDCIRIALENNAQLKNGLLDEQATEYRIKEVKSALLPHTDLNSQYTYYMQLPSQYVPASAFGGPEGSYTKMALTMKQTTSAYVQTTLALFNQSVFTGLQAARAAQETSRASVNLTREDIIYNVTATYYTIQVLQDNLTRLAENITNLEQTVKINEALKNSELLAGNIYNRLLINLENLRNQYENQDLVQKKNISQLKFLMNVDISTPVVVTAFDYSEMLEEPVAADISRRPDILLQESQLRLSEFDKKSIAAGYFPVLSGGLSFGYTGFYDDFAPHRQINNDWVNSSSFSISLKVPLFDGFQKKYQLKQKDVTIRKHVNTLSMMKTNAEKEVQDALDNYTTNKSLLVSNKTSLDLAQELFNSAQGEYASGIVPVTDLLDAQNDLTNARTNYSNALLNVKLAELSLKKAGGSLDENRN